MGTILNDDTPQALVQHDHPFTAASINTTACLMLVLDRDGRIVRFNPACERASGYSFADAQGRLIWEFLLPDEELARVQAAFARLVAGESVSHFENAWLTRDGRRRLIAWSNTALFGQAGQLEHVIATGIDITAQRQAEQELRDSELRYRLLVENVKEVVFQTDAAGLWTFLNRAWTEITGFSVEACLGKLFLDYVHPDDRERNLALFEPLIARQKAYCRHEVRYLTSDGGYRWIEVFARLTLDDNGAIIGTSGTLNDVTDRRHAEDALRMIESQQRAILDNMSDLVFLTDADERCILVNAAFARFFDRTPESFVGQTARDRLPPRLGERQHKENLAIIRSGVPSRHDRQVPDSTGALRWHEISKSPILGPDGTPVGLVGVIRDVTERREAEAALKQAKEAAEAAVQARSAFLATMSHEIRTPLNGVIGMTGLLLDTALTPEQHEYAETARRSGEALLTLINDILDFSKIEAGKLELEMIDFDLLALIEDVVDLLAEQAERKGLALGCFIDHQMPTRLRGDPSRLRQVLTNLVGNAVKFTEQGEVLIRATLGASDADGVLVRITVEDTGVGISTEAQARLFQPFMQADASTTRTYGGTGLGLAICRQIVALMGGAIEVRSAPRTGSVFTVTLRLAWPLQHVPRPTCESLTGRRALVIDDQRASCALLAHLLQGWGIAVSTCQSANDGLAALHHARAAGTPFEIAIIDAALPGLGGLASTQARAGDDGLAAARVILIGAHASREARAAASKLGASAFVGRPIRQSQLFDSLASMLCPETSQHTAAAPAYGAAQPDNAQRAAGRILVVEDNQVNQKVVTLMLTKLGYSVDVAGNGVEALAALARIGYRLVLMDCHMPEMDGFAATAAIREREGAARHTPIIALTANALAGEREHCLAAGMDDYLAKPVQKHELAATLTRWLNGAAAAQAEEPAPAAPAPATLDREAIAQLRAMQEHGEADFLPELRDALVAEIEHGLERLRSGIASGDTGDLAGMGHLLKGSSATMGAHALAKLWGELERHCRSGALAAVAALLEPLEAEWARVCEALDALI
ncbi:MAG: PAS domain S-box protein [Chloroflexales bacterium]|nr:PAS domain S-box protein [Chloroflexales bacterium]